VESLSDPEIESQNFTQTIDDGKIKKIVNKA
jgi:hypothetical protein